MRWTPVAPPVRPPCSTRRRPTWRWTARCWTPHPQQQQSPLLDRVDILTPNETEFVALLGRHVGDRIDADAVCGLDQQRLHALCRNLTNGTVIVTLGSSGCFVSHPESNLRGDASACYRVPAESVRAVDTTGAGDAFNGALAASLTLKPERGFAEHVRFAVRYASRSTELYGAALAMPRMPVE